MDRRKFFGTMVGGVAVAAAVRTWPFRVYSFPVEVDVEIKNLLPTFFRDRVPTFLYTATYEVVWLPGDTVPTYTKERGVIIPSEEFFRRHPAIRDLFAPPRRTWCRYAVLEETPISMASMTVNI